MIPGSSLCYIGVVFFERQPVALNARSEERYMEWNIADYLFFKNRRRFFLLPSAEVCRHHRRIFCQCCTGTLQHNATLFNDIGAVGDGQGALGKLFRKKNRHTGGAERRDGKKDLLDQHGCKPHRRLIKNHKAWAGHKEAANGKHLLLSARKAPGLL